MPRPEFRLDLGAAWLTLLGTVSGRRREVLRDALDRPEDLRRFLAAVGLEPRRRPGEADLRAARELREHLYPLARAAADGTAVPRESVRALSAALAADEPLPVRLEAGRLVVARPADSRAALARLARQAVDDVAGPDPARLRACGDDTCASIFVDATGRRRWCDDARCGSKARVRAHRARHAGTPAAN